MPSHLLWKVPYREKTRPEPARRRPRLRGGQRNAWKAGRSPTDCTRRTRRSEHRGMIGPVGRARTHLLVPAAVFRPSFAPFDLRTRSVSERVAGESRLVS